MKDYAVVIPAAGSGERIKEFSKYIPKPLLLLGPSLTILDNAIDSFKKAMLSLPIMIGVRNDHYDHFKWDGINSKFFNKDIDLIYPFAPGRNHNGYGDLKFLICSTGFCRDITTGIFIMSADSVCHRDDIEDFINKAFEWPDQPLVSVKFITDEDHLKRSGQVRIKESRKFGIVARDFKEKPKKHFSSEIACSLYYIPIKMINDIYNANYDQLGDLVSLMVYKGRNFSRAFRMQGPWLDVSNKDVYIETIKIFNEEKLNESKKERVHSCFKHI